MADRYGCLNVDLLAQLDFADLGGVTGSDLVSDLWGWSHPETQQEVVIISLARGTSFVDVTDPLEPTIIGLLPLPSLADIVPLQDIKVYRDHAFIVGETPGHGMQIVDLTGLVAGEPITEIARYDGVDTAHNLVINEATGFAYVVGSDTCGGGLHIVDINDPTEPTQAGCFADDGVVHDAQCVVYLGPDSDYEGAEICFASNEDTLTIIDVTDKSSPFIISRETYDDVAYTHQGWLSSDSRWFFVGDEVDELETGENTRTIVWDIEDLDAPDWIGDFYDELPAVNHNMYTLGDHLFQANYLAGLRIFDISDPASLNYPLVGSFDTYPTSDDAEFNGAFTPYVYFPSGTIAVSDMASGLFLVRFDPTSP